jgi:hypothetical protein
MRIVRGRGQVHRHVPCTGGSGDVAVNEHSLARTRGAVGEQTALRERLVPMTRLMSGRSLTTKQ